MAATAKEQAKVFELSSNDRSIHDHNNGRVVMFDINSIGVSGKVTVIEFDNNSGGEHRHSRRRKEFTLQDARAYWNMLVEQNDGEDYRRVHPPEFDYVPGYLRTGDHPYLSE